MNLAPPDTADFAAAHATLHRLKAALNRVMQGQDHAISLLLAAFASGGHVLLEDLPGTGKTTLAKAFAKSLDLPFQRIQFTPDLLPADLLGVSIFDPQQQQFRFHRGPLFADVLLADEINRASPRTQSALLEAMEERQVSLDGQRHELGAHFFVVATQNPVEFQGTYPLPEAQMDRFALRFGLGYVTLEQEMQILEQHHQTPLAQVTSVANRADLDNLRQAVKQVAVSRELRRYIAELVAATRSLPEVQLGASPRASLSLMKTAQALALLHGKDFVTPEWVQSLCVPVLAHRLRLDVTAQYSGTAATELIATLQDAVPVPY